ncbi:MAG: PTS sugar transporter subunit IIB [Eubacteriaceae bacterium]|jgi:PTS system cellobiose-specific IIB component
MKILLACCSGMSTSLVVNKMKDADKKNGLDDEIWAVGQGEVDKELPKADVLLIGPQMRMMKKKMEAKGAELGIPVDIIPPVLYGRCDGQGILEMAQKLVAEKK